jgi:transcriptional regulator with GAF, ATPase, and Fis domain
MDVDEKEFFKNATLKICGSLELQEALHDCLMYVREFIPTTEQLGFHIYHLEKGVIETVAYTDFEMGHAVSIKTRLSPMARKQVNRQRSLRIRRINRLGDDPVSGEAASKVSAAGRSAVLLDLVLDRMMLGTFSVDGSAPFSDGEVHLLSLLVKPCAIALTNSMRYRELQRLKELLADDNRYLQEELNKLSGEEIVGANKGLRDVMQKVNQVAPLDSPVLLLGETGTGKEVIANAIHRLSKRKNGPFIKLNCGAIPASLLDSELFGYEKGAFTGATARKRGRIERAHGGTLFLDEIGELSAEAQVRLLRVLQEKEFDRIGCDETIRADVRIIAATHRNLEEMMREKQFRADLFYRLLIFPIILPPLRRRKEDIPDLVYHFILKKVREMKRHHIPMPTEDAMSRLLQYDWPGNIRELENTVERSLILDTGDRIFFKEIGALECTAQPAEGVYLDQKRGEELVELDDVMSYHIKKILRQCKGRIDGEKGVARLLNINASTLRKRMRKMGIAFGRTVVTAREELK